jgi:hypothetical protein
VIHWASLVTRRSCTGFAFALAVFASTIDDTTLEPSGTWVSHSSRGGGIISDQHSTIQNISPEGGACV